MWANVRRGEKNYTSPRSRTRPTIQFDTSLPYELAVFNAYGDRAVSLRP